MTEKQLRHTYYLRGLLPAFISILIIAFSSFTLHKVSTFLMCYLWPYFLFTPGARSRYLGYKYRWSFVGMLVRFHTVVEDGFNAHTIRFRLGCALVLPLLICLMLWAISGVGEPLYALAGVAVFAVVYRYLLHPLSSATPVDDAQTDLSAEPVKSANEPDPAVQNHQTNNDSSF